MNKPMSPVVREVLKEELERSLALREKYLRKLKDYPPGYLLARKLRRRAYYYLSYREGDRIRQKYLGPLSPTDLKEYKDKIKAKLALRRQLKEVKQNIKYLERLLKK